MFRKVNAILKKKRMKCALFCWYDYILSYIIWKITLYFSDIFMLFLHVSKFPCFRLWLNSFDDLLMIYKTKISNTHKLIQFIQCYPKDNFVDFVETAWLYAFHSHKWAPYTCAGFLIENLLRVWNSPFTIPNRVDWDPRGWQLAIILY